MHMEPCRIGRNCLYNNNIICHAWEHLDQTWEGTTHAGLRGTVYINIMPWEHLDLKDPAWELRACNSDYIAILCKGSWIL